MRFVPPARYRRVSAVVALGLSLITGGCASWPSQQVNYNQLDLVARTLHQRARRSDEMTREQVLAVVADNIHKDRYACIPPGAGVLTPPRHITTPRRIDGNMPHYGIFEGPMRYRIGMMRMPNRTNAWLVSLNIAVQLPAEDEILQLPDCTLRQYMEGAMVCDRIPYEQAVGTDACPESGRFEAPASRHNVRVLLAHWSQAVEEYFNRDAKYDELPVRYDFHFFAANDIAASRRPVDLVLPLHSACARQPYFEGLRAGWSLPVLAHEIAHFLGLLDEYEPVSGIFSFYPKTPFEGSERSRMGLSMKTDTHFYPLHHYLILRRYFCHAEQPDPLSAPLSGSF